MSRIDVGKSFLPLTRVFKSIPTDDDDILAGAYYRNFTVALQNPPHQGWLAPDPTPLPVVGDGQCKVQTSGCGGMHLVSYCSSLISDSFPLVFPRLGSLADLIFFAFFSFHLTPPGGRGPFTGCLFCGRGMRFFSLIVPVTCFPVLGTGFMFSRAWHRLYVCIWHRLYLFLPLALVTCFAAF